MGGTMRSRVSIAITIGIILLIALSIVVLRPFLVSITLGASFAIALLPLKEQASRTLPIGNRTAAFLVCVLFCTLVVTPLIFATWSLVRHADFSPNIGSTFESSLGQLERKTSTVITKTANL